MEPTLTANLLTTLTTFVANNPISFVVGVLILIATATFVVGRKVEAQRITSMSNRQFRRLKAK